jgi:superoxide reductase
MTKMLEIYKCITCGNMTMVVHASAGTLVCCGRPMEKCVEKTADQGSEKHVPVVGKSAQGIMVKVGSVPHPMEEKHYIEWIELIAEGKTYRQFLKPGEAPETTFNIRPNQFTIREYCNLHGLWKNQ